MWFMLLVIGRAILRLAVVLYVVHAIGHWLSHIGVDSSPVCGSCYWSLVEPY